MADGDELQKSVEHLQSDGDRRIVAVPLFVSSHSSLYRQTAYLLGVSSAPSKEFLSAMEAMHAHMGDGAADPRMKMGSPDAINHRVSAKVPIALAPALDDDPIVAKILVQRAKALSKDPKKESLVLVAHGPIEADDDRAWNEDLQRLADEVREQLPFKHAVGATLQDDAPPEVRKAAVDRLRAQVDKLSKRTDVIVVPVLISKGGIEGKLKTDLAGLQYRWNGQTLAPDPLLAKWIESRVAQAAPKEPQ
jgi:sirohydrochlorin ferrochelatase